MIRLHFHAKERLECEVTEEEVIKTVKEGEAFPAKYGRIGFRFNFMFNGIWRSKYYATKQIEAYAVKENKDRSILPIPGQIISFLISVLSVISVAYLIWLRLCRVYAFPAKKVRCML